MKKFKLVNYFLVILSCMLILSSCRYNTNSITAVSIFPIEGVNKNYSTSYIAGINYGITRLGDAEGSVKFHNINQTTQKIKYRNIDAIIGTFDNEVINKVLTKKVKLPLITSKNDVFTDVYTNNINIFPLEVNTTTEVKAFAKEFTNNTLVVYSSGAYYDQYVITLEDEFSKVNTEVTFLNVAKNITTYESVTNAIVQSEAQNILLVTNKVDYTGILYNLSLIDFEHTIYIPNYLAKQGTAPFNINTKLIIIKTLNYTVIPVDDNVVDDAFLAQKENNSNINNYYYFRDGYVAYALLLKARDATNGNKRITSALHEIYKSIEPNLLFANVI